MGAISVMNRTTGVLKIRNKQNFATLAWIRGEWELKASGNRVANGKLPVLKTAPQKDEEIELKVPAIAAETGQEAFLNIRFHAATDTAWCQSGHEVGWDQISIPVKTGKIAKPKTAKRVFGPLTLDEREDVLTVENDAFRLVASRETGLIESLRWQEQDFLISGPRLQIWRGPTDNDGIKGWTNQTWRPLNMVRTWSIRELQRSETCRSCRSVRKHRHGSIRSLHHAAGTWQSHRRALALAGQRECQASGGSRRLNGVFGQSLHGTRHRLRVSHL
jgi:beta-galactosidase